MNGKTVLIADDDFKVAQSLSVRLKHLGLSVMRSPDAIHAMLGAHKLEPDLIIMDVNMPGGNGLAVCEMLKSDHEHAKIPVIIYSGCSDKKTRRRCRELGARYVLKSPGAWEELKEIVTGLLHIDVDPTESTVYCEDEQDIKSSPGDCRAGDKAVLQTPTTENPSRAAADSQQVVSYSNCTTQQRPNQKQPKVLCIDDDANVSKVIKIKLEGYGVDVYRAFEGMQGYWTALDIKPDVIITDLSMPDGDGNYVFMRLQLNPATKKIPVIILTGETNPGVKREMFSAGVTAYFTKPLVFDELLRELRFHITLPDEPAPIRSSVTP